MFARRPFRENQRHAFEYGMRVQHPALFMEMRLGKTLVTVRLLKFYASKLNLIVAPFSAFDGWENEIKLERELKYGLVLLEGTRTERINRLYQGLEKKKKYFLINKEGHMVIPEIADVPWNSVVIDESTCLKGEGTSISKFFLSNFRDVDHRFALTGTPAPECETDYFQQCRWLDYGIFKEKTLWEFKRNNFGTINYETLVSPRGSRYISQRLAQYCLFQTRSQYNLGGIKIYEKRVVNFSADNRKIYETLEKEFLLEVEGKVIDSTVYSITKHSWMKKLCGGFVDETFVEKSKLQDMISCLKNELRGQQVVIWARQTHEILMLNEELSNQGFKCGVIYGEIPRQERVKFKEAFQSGLIDKLICQPECFKYGQDLSCTDVMIYYTSPEGGETRSQSEDRTIAVTKTGSSLIIDMVMKDSIEEDILISNRNKESRQAMMRRIVNRLQQKHKENYETARR